MKFYEALGRRRADAYTASGPVWRSENYLYVWDDLLSLATSEPAGTRIQNEWTQGGHSRIRRKTRICGGEHPSQLLKDLHGILPGPLGTC